ncbi:Hypothetical protein PHPALM_3834 [Phytophthora palmivora]|uniref:HTH CENPB-type domain-containing protein n=1 Tax=Phytophthora palmivora TaxID=4796 RepID=A0A2P4YLD4_9STRA|nr:Hypothetical protein PHPALM_3834 [Phytophthora palmivora]
MGAECRFGTSASSSARLVTALLWPNVILPYLLKLKKFPALTTISDILKKVSDTTNEAYGEGKRRKPLRVTSKVLEQRLWAWIMQVEAQNVCLSRELN